MPIDTSIYGNQVQPKFNTPFEALRDIGALQQQQSQMRAAQALEQERQQKIRDQQAIDTAAAASGTLDPSAIAKTLPGHLQSTFLKGWADASDAGAKAKKAMAEAGIAVADLKGSLAAGMEPFIKEANGDPAKLLGIAHTALANFAQHGPEFQQMAQEAAKQLEADPTQVIPWVQKALAESPKQQELRNVSRGHDISQQNATTAATTAAAELPGKTAQSAITTQVAAGTVGGLTPEQQRQAKDRQTQLGIEQARLKAEQDRAAAAATVKAAGKPLSQMEADKISDIDRGISAIRDLRESISTGKTGFVARTEAALVPNAMADLVPGAAAAKSTQADIVRAQQVVGRIVHGGVMRANDAAAAQQYMPQLGDAPSVIKSKLDKAEAAALKTRADHLGNLGKAGYDVSNFAPADTAEQPSAPAASLAPGKVQRVVQDGVTYEVVTDPQGRVIRSTKVQ
jgi:ribosome-associated protein YbcJ (S4-like RNA binding protein)